MINKIKLLLKRLRCKHDMELNRWHWVHFPDHEPLSVEIEYVCTKCKKTDYIHLYKKEAREWNEVMGEYKKVH